MKSRVEENESLWSTIFNCYTFCTIYEMNFKRLPLNIPSSISEGTALANLVLYEGTLFENAWRRNFFFKLSPKHTFDYPKHSDGDKTFTTRKLSVSREFPRYVQV